MGLKQMNKSPKGSSFDDFLEQEKLLDHAEAVATKRITEYCSKLTKDEKELLKSLESGKWQSVENLDEMKAMVKEAAKNHIQKASHSKASNNE